MGTVRQSNEIVLETYVCWFGWVYTGTLCMYIAEMSLLIITRVIISFELRRSSLAGVVAQPRALACIAYTTQSIGLHCLQYPEHRPALPTLPRALPTQPRALACIAYTTQSIGLHCLHNPEHWPALPTQPRALACIAYTTQSVGLHCLHNTVLKETLDTCDYSFLLCFYSAF